LYQKQWRLLPEYGIIAVARTIHGPSLSGVLAGFCLPLKNN